MTEIIRLAPHDPIPSGPGRQVIVLHRFDEDAPKQTIDADHADRAPRRDDPADAPGRPADDAR